MFRPNGMKAILCFEQTIQSFPHTLAFAGQKYPIGLLCHVTSPTPSQWRPLLRINSLYCILNINSSFLVNKELYVSNDEKSILELIKPIFVPQCCCSRLKITLLRDPLVSIFQFTLISNFEQNSNIKGGEDEAHIYLFT